MSNFIRTEQPVKEEKMHVAKELDAQGRPLPTATVLTGATRVTGTGEPEAMPHAGSASFNSGDAESPFEGFKAVTLGGRVLTDVAEIDPKTTRIYYKGVEMRAAAAVGLGLIVERLDGTYALPAKEGAIPKPEEKQADDAPEFNAQRDLSPELHQLFTTIEQHVGKPQLADAILAKTLNAAASGSFEAVGRDLAHYGDIEPAEASAMLEGAVRKGAEDVARHISKAYGIDGAAATAHAATLPEGVRRDLLHRLAAGGSAAKSALKEIVESYGTRE